MTVEEVKPYQDKVAVLRLSDGEVSKVEILFVDVEYNDIIVQIISSSQPERYRHPGAAYAIRVADLAAIEESSD
jgi:hypothetical protein